MWLLRNADLPCLCIAVLVGFAVERVVLFDKSSFIKNIFLAIKCPLSSIYINADERMPHAYR